MQESRGPLAVTLVGIAATIVTGILGPVLNRDWMIESFQSDPWAMVSFCIMMFSFGLTIGSFAIFLAGRRKERRRKLAGQKRRNITREQRAMIRRLEAEGRIVNPTGRDLEVLEQLEAKRIAEGTGGFNTGRWVWTLRGPDA